jgi:putative transposase
MVSDLIVRAVKEERCILPKSGFRQLRSLLHGLLEEHEIGRDALLQILRNNDLMQGKNKRKGARTTNSNHGFKVYENLMKPTIITDILQVIYFDITYIHTLEGFLYLAIGTDAHSRKIVGFDASDSLELTGCLRALEQIANDMPKHLLKGTIHHSDRGVQYCSNQYTRRVQDLEMKISMAALGNCYENAGAESINGILKRELFLDTIFPTKAAALQAITDAIRTYNNYRPHGQLPKQQGSPERYNPNEFFQQRLAALRAEQSNTK